MSYMNNFYYSPDEFETPGRDGRWEYEQRKLEIAAIEKAEAERFAGKTAEEIQAIKNYVPELSEWDIALNQANAEHRALRGVN